MTGQAAATAHRADVPGHGTRDPGRALAAAGRREVVAGEAAPPHRPPTGRSAPDRSAGGRPARRRPPSGRSPRTGWRAGQDRGTVTAELALGLPAVVGVLLAVLLMTSAATTQLRCADGARAGARAAALGESSAAVSATASRVAGPGASVLVRRDGPWVTVTVRRPVATAPLGGVEWPASARASARVEP